MVPFWRLLKKRVQRRIDTFLSACIKFSRRIIEPDVKYEFHDITE
jgi:hypothetical protein